MRRAYHSLDALPNRVVVKERELVKVAHPKEVSPGELQVGKLVSYSAYGSVNFQIVPILKTI